MTHFDKCHPHSVAVVEGEYRFAPIRLPGWQPFWLATPPDTTDPVSLAHANSHYSNLSKVELLLRLMRPGTVFLDLGAHVGTFSLPMAAAGHRVVSVEASPENVGCLQASVARNGFTKMHVVHAAVHDQPGALEFTPAGPWGCVASAGTTRPTIQVKAIAVDRLLAELAVGQVGCIKMDVEGSEIRAIHGMQQLLSGPNAPPILFESNGHTLAFFGQTPQELLEALEKLGYRNFYLNDPPRLIQFTSAELQPETLVDYLAVQALPLELNDWHIETCMSLAECIARMVADCQSANKHHRTHMARSLAQADSLLLSHPFLIEALLKLQKDPEVEVRAAAAWWTTRRSRLVPAHAQPRPLGFNRVAHLEDFANAELLEVMREVNRHKVAAVADWPDGFEEARDWESAMAVRALRAFGALRPDATLLGVAAGTDATLFYLTNTVQEVFAVDRYLATTPADMLVDPERLAPYEADIHRLIVQHMDGRWLRFPDHSFDGIYCPLAADYYPTVQDVANACYEMGRVLKPGGVLALSTRYQLSGAPGQGFSQQDLERYVVAASGLELVEPMSTELSAATWDNRLDLNILKFVDSHIAWDGLTERWQQILPHLYPRIALTRDGASFIAIHLVLRKTERFPAQPNDWARPTRETREAILEWHRTCLSRQAADAPKTAA